MRIQLIQQKVPIGSQVTFTLKTGEKMSGSLAELGTDYVALDVPNGQEILDVEEIKGIHLGNHVDESPDDSVVSSNKDSGASDDSADKTSESSDNFVVSSNKDSGNKDSGASGDSSETVEDPENSDIVGLEEQASEQLDEIEKRFKYEIESANIELQPPDFTFPADELKGWQNSDIAGKWLQIKNKYENAQRINELSTKFGRIQPLLIELTPLVRRFPNSPSLKRAFAYFNTLSHPDDWQKTIHTYQEVAITSDDSNDWFNVAVSALNLNKEELACYSLEKFFHGVSVIDAPDAWYVYISLIEKFNNLSAFRELCRKDENDVVEDEIEVLLDAAIYLLKKKIAAEFAIEIVQRRIKGESAESLLKEVCQKLGGQSAASYRQFLSEFMNDRIAAEEKIRPTTPEPIHPLKRSTPDAKQYEIRTKWMQNNLLNALYRSAEQEDQNGNLEEAERLYQDCIDQDIKRDSAIKNLAMVLVRLGRSAEAVGLLEDNRQKVKDKRALDNVLIAVYPAAAQYEKAIDLLNEALKQAQDHERRSRIRMQIANTYIKLEDYVNAEGQLRRVQKLRPQNITVQRNLAFCLSKQNRYDEAKQILNKIPSAYPAPKTRELLEAIERAQRTGKFNLDEDTIIEIETVLSYFSGELSDFTQFFLNRCAFDGVAPERVSEGKYTGSDKDFRYDISRLEDVAKQLGTRRPRDRGHYYLSAARIYFDLGGNQNLFYRYLCRSFASRGDAAVSENKHLDTVREWYCEALTAYDGDKTRRRRDEQDAVNSLVRYLYSTLGPAHIDLTPNTQTFDKVVRDVINNHPEKKKVFDAIAYLVLHSRFAADRVLNRLYGNETLRTMAVEYLKEMDIEVPDVMKRLVDFVHPWNELRNKKSNADRDTSDKLRLLNNFDLTTSWLEDNIRFAEDIRSSLSFELDRQRVGELQRILESALELCKQVTFEERERLCFQLHSFCQDLLRDIEESPTRVSVEDVYPITEVIQDKVDAYLNELYEASKPQLNLRLPVESYVPDTDRQIEVQIVLENERGRSPAESLELIVQEDKTFFMVTGSEIKQNESLRGGEQSILTVPLRVTLHALQSQTFSLSLCARYRTRTEEQLQTPIQDLSIRLYSEDEFEKIENPYAAYAEGGIVGDTNMFFGREELIQNIAKAIRESRTQSKSVMVFGQKRSGKSSVLYHLKESLREDKELLILDLGNMSTLLDQHAQTSLLHQFLNGILRALKRAIRQKQREGFSSLELTIPDKEFYEYPAPLQLFEDTFVTLKDLTDDQTSREDWRGVRAVLLIDEFQYIYEPIIKGEIPDSFMQNWKALLQANYFSAVLVGQDVMQKFKLQFPNEFGTMQDERVTYLKEEDARALIDEPIRIGGRQGDSRYREQAIERILELTAGSPFYIQIICNRLVDYMNVKRAGLVTEADVEQVKNELIHDVNALGLDKFDNLINSGDTSPDAISDEDALKILKTIADNSNRTDPCHRDKIICETNLPIDTILDDLVNRDVVKRRDQSYQIQVGLFKEWFVVNG
ncbi:DNA-binding protein [Candidatus Poribacteria bacterium]|nr:MAG: DNA-binding protein [Candidatus Poribacteria bacterium]